MKRPISASNFFELPRYQCREGYLSYNSTISHNCTRQIYIIIKTSHYRVYYICIRQQLQAVSDCTLIGTRIAQPRTQTSLLFPRKWARKGRKEGERSRLVFPLPIVPRASGSCPVARPIAKKKMRTA